MLDALSHVNWLAVLLADVAAFMLGGLWFTALFKKPYAYALGREAQPEQKPGALFIVGPLVCTTVATITTAVLLRSFGIVSLGGALAFGAIVGVGYIVSTTVNVAINPNIPRPFVYGLVSGSYFFVSSLVMCGILAAMT